MKQFVYILLGMMMFLGMSCENDPYLYQGNALIWLSGDDAQSATTDSVVYSFMLEEYTVTKYDLHVQAHLTGNAVDYDRHFRLEVVDSLTNVPASAYVIGETVLAAGANVATVNVTVSREVDGLDLENENAYLTLQVVDSDELLAGAEEFRQYKLVWCDYLTEPSSWSYIASDIGPFTKARYKFIIDNFGYTDFEEFNGQYNMIFSLQAMCIEALEEYNSNPENAGRVEGWPYLNDNGEPLEFGSGLSY